MIKKNVLKCGIVHEAEPMVDTKEDELASYRRQ